MEALMAALLGWLAANSDYHLEGVPAPDVVLMAPTELTREFYRDNVARLPADGVDGRALALYIWDDGQHETVYLLNDRTGDELAVNDLLDDPVLQERLLHEHVHHVQHHTGAYERFACTRQGEKDAYLPL